MNPTQEEEAMFLIREVVTCKPGKVAPLVDRFRTLSKALQELGHEPFRLMTDVSGQPFWTLVAETTVASVEQFFALEQQLRGNAHVREAMNGYHDLVESGRREIYRIES